MNYKYFNLPNCDLYVIKTDKFKTIDFKIFLYDEIKKEDVTWRNCLMDTLIYATNKYKTKKELAIKAIDLYSVYLSASNMRFGNYIISKIGISLLNPKYTEADMLDKSLELLHDVIFDPYVENGSFNKEYLNLIKKELKVDRETIAENSRTYANLKLFETMDINAPYAIDCYSDISILDTIDEQNLYQYYKKFMKQNRAFAIMVGDIDEKEITKYMKKYFSFENNQQLTKPIIYEHNKVRQRARIVVEESKYQQSKLAVALKTKDLTTFEYRYVLNIYNAILGGTADSKLMKVIREKYSLAYYVASGLHKADNLLIINSGIDSKNFKKTISLLKKLIKEMNEGNFSIDEINKSKIEYINAFDEALETADGMIDILLGKILFNIDDVEVRKQEILKVSKEDIMKIGSKIHLDTIFLLKGE